ncbi:sporulation protein YpjB [Thalassobacillus sp. CUG 92003]|uniref:sporulation protein YpjB n=1 Tax=Thalassobacillus sp. CUG 92003 TaxID=2736641 RepID=UPI0015E6899F|nr:sporulation protein YpjB [Thalassobacillus sp. CUG 92003]
MGRVLKIAGLILLCIFLFPNGIKAEGLNQDDMQQFIRQYHHLLIDDKIELSKRMYNLNKDKLGAYVEANHKSQRPLFEELIAKLDSAEGERAEWTTYSYGLVVLLDSMVEQNSGKLYRASVAELKQETQNINYTPDASAENALRHVENTWQQIAPATEMLHSSDKRQTMDLLVEQLTAQTDPEEMEYWSSQLLEMLSDEPLETETGMSRDALFWTVLIVGGCIILTLAYVGYRKYEAEKAERVKAKSNS